MSKLIFDLAKEAGLIVFEPLSWNLDAQAPNPESVAKAYKFAELIVRECLEVCNRQANHYVETHNRAATSVADVLGRIIQMHFGVES